MTKAEQLAISTEGAERTAKGVGVGVRVIVGKWDIGSRAHRSFIVLSACLMPRWPIGS